MALTVPSLKGTSDHAVSICMHCTLRVTRLSSLCSVVHFAHCVSQGSPPCVQLLRFAHCVSQGSPPCVQLCTLHTACHKALLPVFSCCTLHTACHKALLPVFSCCILHRKMTPSPTPNHPLLTSRFSNS